MSAPLMEGAHHDLAALLLSRGAVRRGRHLRFVCPAHADRRPSADYEPTLGVWVCRSCGAGGGAGDLARRLGLMAPDAPSPHRRRQSIPLPPPGVSRKTWAPAWTAILAEASRQDRRLAPYRELWRAADWLRPRAQAVVDSRRRASALGDDDPAAWRLLELAARVSTETASVEAMLDDAVRGIDR
jgi:hypothetical protein